KAGAAARDGVREFRQVSLERRHVFLARVDVPRESESFFAKDARGARRALGLYWQAGLQAAPACDVSKVAKHFGGLCRARTRHTHRRSAARVRHSRGNRLE